MASVWEQLDKALKAPFDRPVYYFAAQQEGLLRQAAARVRAALQQAGGDAETTRIAGPSPDLGEVIAAAGAISFFGTPRVVELWEMMPASMKDKDVDELAALFDDLENAVLIVTALFKDKRTATGKKAKRLLDAAGKVGFAATLAPPTRRENLAQLRQCAAALGAEYAPGAAEALLERAGENGALLQVETEKLAAFCGYGTITTAAVEAYSVHNIEADVFGLARQITAGHRAAAYQKLNQLLQLKHEPIMIAGALAGTYIDMYRVRAGLAAQKPLSTMARDFGYSNEYRLQKAREAASAYTDAALRRCVAVLARLDKQLKSSALHDKSVLLQAAVGQLMLLRRA